MNYKKIYDQLVEKCRVRGLDKSALVGYHESHHVIPRCLGGGNSKDNLVLFTAREHFIAHWLLWKTHPESTALMRAFWLMSHTRDTVRSSKIYAKLRQEYSKSARVKMTEMRSNTDLSKDKSSMFKNLVGMSNNQLTVIEFSHWETDSSKKQGVSFWKLLCVCGNTVVKRGTSFTNGKVKSCGCQPNPSRTLLPWLKYSPDAKAHKHKWATADIYYDAWVLCGKPTKSRFLTSYNKLNLTNLPGHYFNSLVDKFMKGWVPNEDSEWLDFRKSYSEVECQ